MRYSTLAILFVVPVVLFAIAYDLNDDDAEPCVEENNGEQWVTITFDVKGGDVKLSPMKVEIGGTYTVPGYTGHKNGFEFIGWYITYKGVEYRFEPGHEVYIDEGSEDTTAVAIWMPVNNSLALAVMFIIATALVVMILLYLRLGPRENE